MTVEQDVDTWHVEVTFKPTGHVGGEPWLVVENFKGPVLPILGEEGFLGLEFEPGIAIDKALEVLELLNRHVRFVTYTGPKCHAQYCARLDVVAARRV